MIIFLFLFELKYRLNFLFKKKAKNGNILIVQLSGIGDAILALPFIEFLSTSLNKEIYILTKPSNYSVYKNQDFIKEIYLDNLVFINLQTIKNNKIIDVISIRSDITLLKYFFYLPIRLFPNPHFERTRFFSRFFSRLSILFKKRYYSKVHVVNLFNKYLYKKGHIFYKLNSIYTEDIPFEIYKFISEVEKPVIFHFFGNDNVRKLKLETVYKVIDLIDANLILLGSINDKGYITIPAKHEKRHFDAIGMLSINQISKLVNLVNYAIVVDSSIMHISTFNPDMKIVALMGNAMIGNYGPLIQNNNNLKIINRNSICSPCSKHTCNKYNGFSCIQDISAEEIIAEFNKLV
jgi:ADP-heptose:LPS heptosyltransferase